MKFKITLHVFKVLLKRISTSSLNSEGSLFTNYETVLFKFYLLNTKTKYNSESERNG